MNTVKTKEMASDSQRSKPTSQHIREAHGEHWAQDNWISLRGWIRYWSIYLPICLSLSVCISLCLMLGLVGERWGEGFPNKNNSPNSGIIKSLKDSEGGNQTLIFWCQRQKLRCHTCLDKYATKDMYCGSRPRLCLIQGFDVLGGNGLEEQQRGTRPCQR